MKEGFRQSMAWLHTWTGLVVGWVLFFIFLTGTAGYINNELNRWMQPERPLQGQEIPLITDQMQKAYQWLKENPKTQNAERWGISFMSDHRGRDDLTVNWSSPPEGDGRGEYNRETLDPLTGKLFAEQTKPRETGGGDELYYMHYALHYIPYDWAIRIVGICTMFMFIAIITGVITHKKIFKDFFTFRGAKGQRSWLDAHNVLSVISLPFHIMITYSGLIFFINVYMPFGVPLVYGEGAKSTDKYYAELYPNYNYGSNEEKLSATVGEIAPNYQMLEPIIYKVQQQWGNNIGNVNFYPAKGNDPSKLEFYKAGSDSIERGRDSLDFNLVTGEEIIKDKGNQEQAPLFFGSVLLGLHEGLFATPFLRWMYVLTGLIGTAMIATGLILWTVKRRPKQIKAGKMTVGHALVERLNIALIVGLPLGISVYFWANRLLPVDMTTRAAWEMHSLFITLLVVLIYSFFRPIGKAWFEVLVLTAAMYLLLPILNAITTDRHLWMTFTHKDWTLFSIDIGFILLGLFFAYASRFTWKKRKDILNKPISKNSRPRNTSAKTNVEQDVSDT